MKKILVTGGTVFVSRYIAEYYVAKGYDVYVLNRNSREQSKGVRLIEADRFHLGEALREHSFDVVIDTAYSAEGVNCLLDAIGHYEDYIFISSSAVYPEYGTQPFKEEARTAENKYWGKYGTDKIEAEKAVLSRAPSAYILRPPYLYGQMNNVYREAFVFDCALSGRRFYLPENGEMKLQFFHVEDLCRFIDVLLVKRPQYHVFNVGNQNPVSVRQWVEMCYNAVGKEPEIKNVYDNVEQRKYFCFYDYEYYLDVSRQHELMPDEKDLCEGLKEAFAWYKDNSDKVNKKPYFEFIDNAFESRQNSKSI